MFTATGIHKLIKSNSATYINNIRVDEAGNPLVFAHDPGVLVVRAVAVAPAARLAQIDALLAPVAYDIVQPDFPWTGTRLSADCQQAVTLPGLQRATGPGLEVTPGSLQHWCTDSLKQQILHSSTYTNLD